MRKLGTWLTLAAGLACSGCHQVESGWDEFCQRTNNLDPSTVAWDEIEIIPLAWDGAQPVLVAEGFDKPCSPTADATGHLYFADAAGGIHRFDRQQNDLGKYRDEPTRPRCVVYCNGSMVMADADGQICRLDDSGVTTLMTSIGPVRDIAADQSGNLYLAIGTPESQSSTGNGTTPAGVYFLPHNSHEPRRIVEMADPAAIALLGRDDEGLYVLDRGTGRLLRFTLMEPGQAIGWSLVRRVDLKPGEPAAMTVDRAGNLYMSEGDGVQVLWSHGRPRTRFVTGEPVTGLAFAGVERDELFITTPGRVYMVNLNTHGR